MPIPNSNKFIRIALGSGKAKKDEDMKRERIIDTQRYVYREKGKEGMKEWRKFNFFQQMCDRQRFSNSTLHSDEKCDLIRYDTIRYDTIRYDEPVYHEKWYDLIWHDMIW